MLVEQRRGLALALGQRPQTRQVPGEPVRRAHQEVPGAHGRIANLNCQDGGFSFRRRLAPYGGLDNRI